MAQQLKLAFKPTQKKLMVPAPTIVVTEQERINWIAIPLPVGEEIVLDRETALWLGSFKREERRGTFWWVIIKDIATPYGCPMGIWIRENSKLFYFAPNTVLASLSLNGRVIWTEAEGFNKYDYENFGQDYL